MRSFREAPHSTERCKGSNISANGKGLAPKITEFYPFFIRIGTYFSHKRNHTYCFSPHIPDFPLQRHPIYAPELCPFVPQIISLNFPLFLFLNIGYSRKIISYLSKKHQFIFRPRRTNRDCFRHTGKRNIHFTRKAALVRIYLGSFSCYYQ